MQEKAMDGDLNYYPQKGCSYDPRLESMCTVHKYECVITSGELQQRTL